MWADFTSAHLFGYTAQADDYLVCAGKRGTMSTQKGNQKHLTLSDRINIEKPPIKTNHTQSPPIRIHPTILIFALSHRSAEVRTTRKTGGLLTAISRCYQASVSRRWLSLSAVRLLALRLQPHSFVQALLLLTRSSP